ncbi:MAG: aldo/keto reductase [Sedimentisphaerales bacterium]|nr:aldo/keto reductase [Sedimentisphaerales bacterium]
MKRRQFLKQSAAAAMLSCFPATLSAIERQSTPGTIERRALGKTGEKLSIVAFGGFMLNRATAEQARAWIREAFEAGVNHYDVAPEYGTAEELMGPALEPFRAKAFLSCKTAQRRQAEAGAELDRSLKRLRTDHFDLYQFHHVTRLEEVEMIFSEDGAIKAFEKAKKDGKVRFLGFSAHSVEAALALMERFSFDSIMFPVNYSTWHAGNFGPQVLAKAQEKKMGILALKAMAKQPWPAEADRSAHPNCWYQPMTDPEEAMMGLRFTLSHPVTTALTPASSTCLKLALQLAPRFAPLKPEEVEVIKQKGLATRPLFRYQPKT